ncbi:WD40-repeat-containing domain protein [Panaeolus papilionaceus]|nr:WD40-repeat-containing domain protein [Panaeolus papilionaceus]
MTSSTPVSNATTPSHTPDSVFAFNSSTDPTARRQFLNAVLAGCSYEELLYISSTITSLLRRDFLLHLPPEIGYHILSFIDEPKSLMRASLVSKHWMRMIRDETLWRRMCLVHGFENWEEGRKDLVRKETHRARKGKERDADAEGESDAAVEPAVYKFSYRRHYRTNYMIKQNWTKGGRMLQTHRIRNTSSGDDTVTSLAMDEDWIVVGLSSSRIKVYSTATGVLCRTLVGHESGVWGVWLAMKGGSRIDPQTAAPHSASNNTGQGANLEVGLASGSGSSGLGSRDTFFLNPQPSEQVRVSIVQDPATRKKSKRREKDNSANSLPNGILSLRASAEPNATSSSSSTKKASKSPGHDKTKKQKKREKETKFRLPKAAVADAKFRGVDIDPPPSYPPHSASSSHPPRSGTGSHLHSHLDSTTTTNANHPSDGMHVMPNETHDHLLSPLLRLALGLDPLDPDSSSGSDSEGGGDGTGSGSGSGSDVAVVGGVQHEDGKGESESTGGSSCAEAGSDREEAVEDEDEVQDGRGGEVNSAGAQRRRSSLRVRPQIPQPPVQSSAQSQAQHTQQHVPQQSQPPPEPRFQMLPDDLSPNQPTVDPKLCMSSVGWGQPNSIIVSGGCDKVVRVWDARSGYCIYVLHGHTSTIRSLRVLDNRPIAITGARDSTLRVWDIQRGRCVHVLEGHDASVRCLDVSGNTVVSGSYDGTCRVWNVDTGECLHVLRGHFSQIYSVAFDGIRIASGGLDTTVRIWDATTGHCTALLQGHSALICTLQLSKNLLITGSADGRVITFSLLTLTKVHCISAHDSSVTSLQFNEPAHSSFDPSSRPSTAPSSESGAGAGSGFLVTGGNDGRARLWDVKTGEWIRDLTIRSECVWKVGFLRDIVVVLCKRAGSSHVEIWSLRGLGKRRRGTVSASATSPTPTPLGGGDAVAGLLGVGSAD